MLEEKEAPKVLELLTDIGVLLMTSGAHTARIIRNLERFAKGLGYHSELVLTMSGIVISIYKNDKLKPHTLARTVKDKGVNFEIISDISILSWKVLEENLSISEIQSSLKAIRTKKVYTNFQLYFFAPFASVALCMLFDGNWIQAILVYFTTLAGFAVRRQMHHRHANHFMAFFVAAIISTFLIHLAGVVFHIHTEQALVVSILYLIPGVVMINAFIDYLQGYSESGTARFVFSLIAILMLAFGFFVSDTIFNLPFISQLSLFDLSSLQTYITQLFQPTGFLLHASKFIFGGITSLGFALIFNTSKRAMWTVFILGATGYYIKYLLFVGCDINLIISIFTATTFVGISAMYFAHKTHTPPIIFMIPAVINMIPGLLSYEFMMGMIDWISGEKGSKPSVEVVIQTFSYGISTFFILFALAFGIAFPIIVFNSKSVKDKDLKFFVKKIMNKKEE
jgi:uncharacterized membrane protein YjjP (DUF1212 family)